MGYKKLISMHFTLGKIAFLFSIISICGAFFGRGIVGALVSIPSLQYSYSVALSVFSFFFCIGFLATTGGFVYWSKEKEPIGLFTIIIGFISLLIIGYWLLIAIFVSIR